MATNKTKERKTKLSKYLNQNRRVPVFVMMKTRRRVTRNPRSRNWRFKKLKLKD